jgi:hypothetical protein
MLKRRGTRPRPLERGRYLPTLAVVAIAATVHAAGLAFAAPPGWRKVATTSSMRVADFALPHVEGDSEDAELVLYYFGGGGGSVEANMQRWVGQMQQPDGRDSGALAKREARKVNGLDVTLLDLTGTYVAEMAPGASERNNKPKFRMRAAVIETPQGPYYIKLVGPERTIAKWSSSFDRFLGSLKFAP